jgi:hypothetical protein
VPIAPQFEARARRRPKPLAQVKLEQELEIRRRDEDAAFCRRFAARKVLLSTVLRRCACFWRLKRCAQGPVTHGPCVTYAFDALLLRLHRCRVSGHIRCAVQVPLLCSHTTDGLWMAREQQRAASAPAQRARSAAAARAAHALPFARGGPPAFADTDAARCLARSARAAAILDAEAAALQHGITAPAHVQVARKQPGTGDLARAIERLEARERQAHEWLQAVAVTQLRTAAVAAARLDVARAAARAEARRPFSGSYEENIIGALLYAACAASLAISQGLEITVWPSLALDAPEASVSSARKVCFVQ